MDNNAMFYLFHGRFPSEKAAAVYTHENAKAFSESGAMMTVVAPRRFGRKKTPTVPYRIVLVPTLDFFWLPGLRPLAFWLSYIVYSIAACCYLLVAAPRDAFIISNEPLPLFLASHFFRNTLYEIHDFPEHHTWFYGMLLRRVRFILATNQWKRDALKERFSVLTNRVIVEPNGVDVDAFALSVSVSEARSRVGVTHDDMIVLYTGHLYGWKGVDTLAQAATFLPEGVRVVFVGGTAEDLASFQERYDKVPNIEMVGHVSHALIPLWLRAADILVLPNTAREEISAQYTSPMKLFEYLASGRPIIASDIPSIRAVVSDAQVLFVSPDNPAELAESVKRVWSDSDAAQYRVAAAQELAQKHSWERRAARILARIS